MKEKTAMTELIEILERAKLHFVANKKIVAAIDSCKLCAVDLLEKEKEQMIDFGINCAFYGAKNPNQSVSEGINDLNEKFNETYKQD